MAVTILPRGPRDNFLTGTLAEYQRDPLAFVTRTARRYGDVVFLRFGPTRLVLLSHPDLVEEVLITRHERFPKQRLVVRVLEPALGNGLFTSEGDFWRRQRRMMQPAFHRERLAAYADAMVACTQRRLATWRDGKVSDPASTAFSGGGQKSSTLEHGLSPQHFLAVNRQQYFARYPTASWLVHFPDWKTLLLGKWSAVNQPSAVVPCCNWSR